LQVECQLGNISAISWGDQVNFQWDDNEDRFVLDQQAWLDFISACSLKQQFADRCVAPIGHIILIQSQPIFAFSLSNAACLAETTNTKFTVWFDLKCQQFLLH